MNHTIFCTTVLRESINRELTGSIYKISWSEKSVLRSIPVPMDSHAIFWNGSGGNRGGRGIGFRDGILYAATATGILKLDSNLNITGSITHPIMAGLHDIFLSAEGIWLTATLHDIIVLLDYDGQVLFRWDAYKDKSAQKLFSFSDREIDIGFHGFSPDHFVEQYNQYAKSEIFHFNAIWAVADRTYTLSCRKKSFLQIRPHFKRIFTDESLCAPHNAIITEDQRVVVNNTRMQKIHIYSLATGKLLDVLDTRVSDPGNEKSSQFVTAGWQRGLFPLCHPRYIAGTSPASLFEVNIDTGKIEALLALDTDVRHSIHGIYVLPEDDTRTGPTR